MYEPLIEAIRAEMNVNKLRQADMARSLHISQAMLSCILSGKRGIGVSTLSHLLQARPAWWELLNGRTGQPLL